MRTPGPEAAEGVSAQTRHVLRAKLVNEPWCEEHIDAAFAGKVKAARSLMYGAGNHNRPAIVAALHQAEAPASGHPGGARRALEPRSPPCPALSRETLSSSGC